MNRIKKGAAICAIMIVAVLGLVQLNTQTVYSQPDQHCDIKCGAFGSSTFCSQLPCLQRNDDDPDTWTICVTYNWLKGCA